MKSNESEQSGKSTQNGGQSHLTLLHTLKGHTDTVHNVVWSPDGHVLTSGSRDNTIRLWDGQTGGLLQTLEGHEGIVWNVAWSPDGRVLASCSNDQTIRLWDEQTGGLLQALEGHEGIVFTVAWSPNGRVLASGSDDGTIRLWDGQTGRHLQTLEGHGEGINSVVWSPDGLVLASGSDDATIRLWDGQTGRHLQTLEGHESAVYSVAWSPDGHVLASGSLDKTIRLWDGQTGNHISTLESHTDCISGISFSSEGRLLASKSDDGTVRVWRTASWEAVEILNEESSRELIYGVAFHPQAPILATLGEKDTVVRIWDVDVAALLGTTPATASVHYTTAKIALVGDSAVGKSGLGYRIAEDRFQITESTHGQQFWVVDKLGKMRHDGTQCEAVLWDFAGQPNFRPIHALFLEDVDLALVLFDPSRPDTLAGVDYWLKQLTYKQHVCRTVLVAARTDVSQLSLTSPELEAFCLERDIIGGWIATSAKTKTGIEELLELMRQHIDWDAKPTTITTQTFKRIKDYVLALKADADRSSVLVSPGRLRELLEAVDPNLRFSDAEMLAAVGHLQNHGYVTILRRSSDDYSILLVPDLLINLAASLMLKAQSNEKGLGALEESRVIRNEYNFPEVEQLSNDERDILLRAAAELFLNHNICFRESVDNLTFLVFPSLILERPPRLTEDVQLIEDMTYVVTGQVENVYAALVVLSGYAPSFQRINQWRKQAQYETVRNEVCGFKLTNDDAGELELVLYYGKSTPDFVRARFQGLFEEILFTRNVAVSKYAPVLCANCGYLQERSKVIRRTKENKTFLFCDECGEKINLPILTERLALNYEDRAAVTHDQVLSMMRTTYESALSSVKKFVLDRGQGTKQSCFISYAWGDPVYEHWVLRLADDLRKSDFSVVLDQWDSAAIGTSLTRFISRIEECDFILAVGTPAYRQKYENMVSPHGSVVAAEIDLMSRRLIATEAQKASVLPLLLEGEEQLSFPPLLQGRVYANFKQEEHYLVTLFDLVLTLFHIPFDDSMVRDLRERLLKEASPLASRR